MQPQLPCVCLQPQRATKRQDLQMLPERFLRHRLHYPWHLVYSMPKGPVPKCRRSNHVQVTTHNIIRCTRCMQHAYAVLRVPFSKQHMLACAHSWGSTSQSDCAKPGKGIITHCTSVHANICIIIALLMLDTDVCKLCLFAVFRNCPRDTTNLGSNRTACGGGSAVQLFIYCCQV
jgi:hypothetical protein